MKAKEYKIEYTKDINGSWCGSAYLINADKNRTYCITVEGGVGVKNRVAKSYIADRLVARCEEFIAEEPGFERVNKPEYDAFRAR